MGPSRQALQIGEWIADPRTNELRRGREVARIEPKAMDVLMLLAAHAGRVVAREEIFSAVWRDVVVGDEALTQSVNKLRRALADDSRAPRYIETISKRGYRLVAPVAPARDARPRRPRAAAALAAIVLLLAALAGTWLYTRDDRRIPEPAEVARETWVTVTVKPFEFVGDEPGRAYLARGIGENLAAALSRASGLRVIRHSAAAPPHAARYLVSGSVQRGASALRVNVYLVDNESGRQIWSDRFEREDGDLLEIQDDITRHVVELLPAKVSDVERERMARRYTRSLEAYDQFLRAQALFLARTPESNRQARELYLHAVSLDPRFARAYAGLAMTHAMEHRLQPGGSPALARALELAQTASSIDPDIPEVYWATAFVHAQGRRHDEAIAQLDKAIELDRSFADAYALLGGIHTYVGEPAKSLPLLRTAMRLNPDGGYLYLLLLGRAYFFQGDQEQALINLRAAAERNAADVETRLFLAAASMAAGDEKAARWEADEIRSLEPGFSLARWLESYPMTSASQKERLSRLLAGVV